MLNVVMILAPISHFIKKFPKSPSIIVQIKYQTKYHLSTRIYVLWITYFFYIFTLQFHCFLHNPQIKKYGDQKSRDFYFQKIPGLKNPGISRREKSRDEKIRGLKFSKNPRTKNFQKILGPKNFKNPRIHTSLTIAARFVLFEVFFLVMSESPNTVGMLNTCSSFTMEQEKF